MAFVVVGLRVRVRWRPVCEWDGVSVNRVLTQYVGMAVGLVLLFLGMVLTLWTSFQVLGTAAVFIGGVEYILEMRTNLVVVKRDSI